MIGKLSAISALVCGLMVFVHARGASGGESGRGETGPTAYALLIGSNQHGEGQTELRFARDDAALMQLVLSELGNYTEQNITLLEDPDAPEVRESLKTIEGLLTQHAARDEQTIFLFYYSGHARSNGINLGTDTISLTELRARLLELPTTVTLVILDACQSGAISNVKGVEPAADFSHNSAAQLNTAGTVLIASSSSSELSQESLDLKGSFFTHHFTVGLRGAADVDRNGMVTLYEAYEYAYHAVLKSTAVTAVGKQHVTLETDLSGKGEMVLTWTDRAEAKLKLPEEMNGEILLTHRASKRVLAEIRKAGGKELLLAFPQGEYEALVRAGKDSIERCEVNLVNDRIASLDQRRCETVVIEDAPVKGVALRNGASAPRAEYRELLFGELSVGVLAGHDSDYSDSLQEFRYDGLGDKTGLSIKAGVGVTLMTYLSIVLGYSMLAGRTGSRQLFAGDKNEVSWRSHAAGVYLRGRLPLKRGLVVPYAQAGGGYVWTTFQFVPDGWTQHNDVEHSYHLGGALGLQLNPWSEFGFTLLHLEYVYAPTLKNDLGDRHLSGGLAVLTGLRAGF